MQFISSRDGDDDGGDDWFDVYLRSIVLLEHFFILAKPRQRFSINHFFLYPSLSVLKKIDPSIHYLHCLILCRVAGRTEPIPTHIQTYIHTPSSLRSPTCWSLDSGRIAGISEYNSIVVLAFCTRKILKQISHQIQSAGSQCQRQFISC